MDMLKFLKINILVHGYGGNLSVTVNTDRNSPNYGQLDQESIVSSGLEYDEDSSVEFVGGFEP